MMVRVLWFVLGMAWLALTITHPGMVWAFFLGLITGIITGAELVMWGQKKGWLKNGGER
jgi:hypothetical protein